VSPKTEGIHSRRRAYYDNFEVKLTTLVENFILINSSLTHSDYKG
jgi:hypothetical protein